jgi:hypothetical protein
MYIIEKLIRLYMKVKTKDLEPALPNNEDNAELEDVITCKHTFMPIDSTGRILACSKCGYLVTKKRASKKKN